MQVRRRLSPIILSGFPNSSPMHISDTPGWREAGNVRVNCLAQEHNTMTQAKARTDEP